MRAAKSLLQNTRNIVTTTHRCSKFPDDWDDYLDTTVNPANYGIYSSVDIFDKFKKHVDTPEPSDNYFYSTFIKLFYVAFKTEKRLPILIKIIKDSRSFAKKMICEISKALEEITTYALKPGYPLLHTHDNFEFLMLVSTQASDRNRILEKEFGSMNTLMEEFKLSIHEMRLL
jgi:hypothetical protein